MVQYDQTIPPGGKGKITLKIQTKGFNSRIKKTVRIFSNDPKNPKVTIAIAGNLWVPVLVNKNRVFLRGMVGEEITNTVIIKGQKQEPMELSIISVFPPEKVAVQLHRTEDSSYEVSFINILKDEGFYSGEVKLQTNYVDEPDIKIQVMGYIQSHILARPRMVSFGSLSEKLLDQLNRPGGFLATREVSVYSTKGDNLKIEKVELEKKLFTVTKNLEPDGKHKLLVKPIPERLSKGQQNDFLRVHTNQMHRKIIEIPIYLTITE